MARPEVSISATNPMFVGREVVVEIDVTTTKETKVDFINTRLVGDQGWSIGSGDSKISYSVDYPRLEFQVMGPGVLPAGTTTRFSARYILPQGTPPTHEIAPGYARMTFSVHVSIPWRLDGRYHYNFKVRVPPPAVVRKAVLIRSTGEPNRPRIEIGLASSWLVAGEDLVGTCAVYHLDDAKPREVSLDLVPDLTLLGRGRARERRGREIGTTLTIPAGSAGTSVPFRLPLPASMTPTFEAATHALRWWLVARTGSFFGTKVDVSVPLDIVDASAAATTPRLQAAPRLGDERIARVFSQFATNRGWRNGEAGAADFAIEREIHGSDMRIAYAYRGQEGTFLVATVHSPSVGLGIAVSPSSSLRHVFFHDVEVDIDAWDRANHVTARSPAQAIPFLKDLVPTLMRCASLGTMVRWNDTEIVFERAVTDVDDAELDVVGAQLELIALMRVTAESKVGAPPGLVTDLTAWHSLATWLGGTLALGDLAIRGTLDGAKVDLGLTWNAEKRPVGGHVAVGDPLVSSEELRKIVISLPHPAADVLAANAAERLVDPVTRWSSAIVDLHVADGVASALYLLPAGDPPAADAAQVRALVEGLRAVLGALVPAAGPYR